MELAPKPVTDFESHRARHRYLHRMFDELAADWVKHTDGRPSSNSVLDLMKWSNEQRDCPTGPHGDEPEV